MAAPADPVLASIIPMDQQEAPEDEAVALASPILLTASPVSEEASFSKSKEDELTPIRAHYLKKSLITLQFARELDGLTSTTSNPSVSPLSYLGAPFTPPPKDAPRLDFPFLKFIFRQSVLPFPFFASAPKNFFPQKLQPFVTSFLSRNLSLADFAMETGEKEDGTDPGQNARQKMLSKAEKQFGLLLTSSTKLIEKEEVVRLTQKDLDRLAELARRRQARERKSKDMFEVNIVCVRHVVEKGRVRSRAHEEFIIRTRRSHQPDVFVSRRYGDFKTLADELRKAHPDHEVRPPPPKDRTAVVTPPHPSGVPFEMPTPPTSPTSPRKPGFSRSAVSSTDSLTSAPPMPGALSRSPSYHTITASRLAREKNRMTLRSYLHSLLSSSTLASSPVLKSFLLSGPTKLTPEEVEDSKRRLEADEVREKGKKRFASEVAARVDGLRDAVKSVKGDLMGKDGLTRIFATIKVNPNIRDLPDEYKAVQEWGRISLASTIFEHFVAHDTASESLASLKRLHGLFPYFVMKGILRVSNPMAMVRGILDLFLAQPFGGPSLLQRMFTTSMMEEVKSLKEDIEAVQDKVADPAICEKIRQFVYAPKEIQNLYRSDAGAERLHLVTVILRSPEAPKLSRPQIQRVFRASRAHAEYLRYRQTLSDSDDDDGPQNEDAWLYEDLSVLGKLYARLRDRQQLMDLIFEGTTSELLKDIITIFYAPLATVYKAANIADSLGDVQNFINDLIRTVEQVDERHHDPQRTVQAFIDLVQRHEQSFYSFVHKVHSKGDSLFNGLMKWIESFLTLVREGLGDKISLEFLLPHTGPARTEILKEVDKVVLYHYKFKVAREEKVRKRFGNSAKGEVPLDGDIDDAKAQALVQGVVRELSFGELVSGDAQDLEEEEETEDSSEGEEDDEDEDDEEETGSDGASEEESTEDDSPSPPPLRTPVPIKSPNGQYQSLDPTTPTRGSTAQRATSPPRRSQTAGPMVPIPQTAPSNITSFQIPRNPSAAGKRKDPISIPLPTSPISVSPGPKSAFPSTSSASSLSSGKVPKRSATMHSNTESSASSRQGSFIFNGPAQLPPPVPSKRRQGKRGGLELEPPELKAIPELMPLFLEMMTPLLRPRTV